MFLSHPTAGSGDPAGAAEQLPRRYIGEQVDAMKTTILVVDDKASVRTLLQEYLTESEFRVVTADNGCDALFVAEREKPDLILLDIMMPEMSGYEFMRVYRKEQDTPIILLTAKLEETDKVLGLELGADDYVTKPFGMRELVARIRAVLRRAGHDTPQRSVQVGDRSAHLTPTEFDLLAVLMSAPGRVFSRYALLEEVQGIAFSGLERSINVHISNLRAKIEPDPGKPRYVETVFGVGYRFRPDQAQ
jgi:DNA-binding response OmpR family regulator